MKYWIQPIVTNPPPRDHSRAEISSRFSVTVFFISDRAGYENAAALLAQHDIHVFHIREEQDLYELFSSIRNADRVLYFNGDGKISSGSHDELMQQHDEYKNAVEWQITQSPQPSQL